MKTFERIKRIPTWEECRERCNNHEECEHFRFKVGEISVELANDPLVCIITEKAPTRAFSWLKAATTAFTFKTLLGHYGKQALTPW